LIMVPYGFALAVIFSIFRESTRNAIESPYVMITLILLWLALSFVFGRKK